MRSLAKLTWMELKLFSREPFAMVFAFAFPLIVLIVLASIFGEGDAADFGGVPPRDYYLASYAGVVVAAIGLIALPVHVAGYRERGILRRFRASSVPVWNVVGSQVIASLVMAILGILVLVAAGTLIYDAGLPESYGGVILAVVVGTLSILALGLLLAAIVPTARAAQGIGMMLFFPMWILSGAGPPPSVMTEGMHRVAAYLPLTYVVEALQRPWVGSGSNGRELLVLVGILIVAAGLSLRLFRST